MWTDETEGLDDEADAEAAVEPGSAVDRARMLVQAIADVGKRSDMIRVLGALNEKEDYFDSGVVSCWNWWAGEREWRTAFHGGLVSCLVSWE